MKKKLTLFMLLSLVSVLTSVAATSGIDFSKIQRWVGTGNNKAALAIKWADGQGDGKTLVWGYRWQDGEQPTGEMLLKAVAKVDPNFYILAKGATQYGSAIAGLGYDWNGDAEITVMDDENDSNIQYPRNGVTEAGDGYRFDHFFAGDGDDLWNAGWYNGYWSYWVADNISADFGYSGSGCTGRKLTDGCVDAWVFSPFSGGTNSYDGNLYYLPAVDDTKNYSEGAFVVNEDWFGHRNSAITFLSAKGNWNYSAVENIGCTACYGTFYGNKFYVIAKQQKDGGDTRTGGRITICDQGTMKVLKQIEVIDENLSNCDGRAFVGVDENKGYVSTSKGIYVLDLDKQEISGKVKSDFAEVECGSMILLNGQVFAVVKGKGIAVIDPSTNEAVAMIKGSFGSIVLSKDGNLWASYASGGLGKVDVENLSVAPIELPDGVGTPSTSWFAWTPDGLCASAQHNVIYWTVADGWTGARKIYKYDIDNNQFTKYIDITNDPDSWYIYGSSFRVDPVTDEAYIGLYKGWGALAHEYTIRKFDAQGNQISDYPMESEIEDVQQRNCWFPGIFVFPDTEDPVWSKFEQQTIHVGSTTTIDLSKFVTDADNMDVTIAKSIVKVSNANVTATLDGNQLTIAGVKEGNSTITLKANSNGIVATTTLSVKVDAATGIKGVENTSDIHEVARYTVDGKRISAPQKGINIVRMSDGSTRKVVVK
ncbi:MAG TPA: DUF5074 domain-containing protein [Prevotella sp.]|nr:DUF5074 domain-containing protein [Prevotella sp.]